MPAFGAVGCEVGLVVLEEGGFVPGLGRGEIVGGGVFLCGGVGGCPGWIGEEAGA